MSELRSSYIGRFAPSPTGPLHAGSLVAALASWLDARAHGGQWLVRIEDIDPPRCMPGADEEILRQLAACGLLPDARPQWQSARHQRYQGALEQLRELNLAYPCGCTRKDMEAAWLRLGLAHERHVERPYPGTCRDGLHGKPARAWRFALERFVNNGQAMPVAYDIQRLQNAGAAGCATPSWWQKQRVLHWLDRRLGPQQQQVQASVGDFVLRRADGLWAYQLAVVVDDADQGVTDVVRGEDLADNTPRQLLLQRALALPAPRYLHTPLVMGADGQKLSKQNGATALATNTPAEALAALQAAAAALGLAPSTAATPAEALASWIAPWAALYNPRP